MKQVGWRSLTSWYMTGVLISVSVRLAMSVVHHFRFGPAADMGGPISSLLTPPMFIGLFCLLCAPLAIVSLYGWARTAGPRPVIEHTAMRRYFGLSIVALFIAAGTWSVYLLFVVAVMAPSMHFFASIRQDVSELVPAFCYIIIAVVAPRVVIKRLRQPLAWRHTA